MWFVFQIAVFLPVAWFLTEKGVQGLVPAFVGAVAAFLATFALKTIIDLILHDRLLPRSVDKPQE